MDVAITLAALVSFVLLVISWAIQPLIVEAEHGEIRSAEPLQLTTITTADQAA